MVSFIEDVVNCVCTEEEIDAIVELLIKETGCPEILDYIFYPENDEVTAEEILEKALSYKSINL